jgi:hypothetical protein
MSERRPTWFGFAVALAFLALVCVSTILLTIAARGSVTETLNALLVVIVPIAGLVAAAGAVLYLIDRLNRHDDPRSVKNPAVPPEPPSDSN